MSRDYETTFIFGGELSPTFTNAIRRAEGSLKGFGNVVSRVAQYTGAFALVTGVTDAIGNMTGAIIGSQDAMAQLQASTGATIEEMQALSQSAKNLYNQNLGEDWYDVAESLSVVKQVTHQTGAELEKTTKNAMVYRDVFGEEIQQSIKASDTMMKNFGITSDQAYNLLAQGAQKGLNKSDELIDSANEYAPYFSALGFSANQMFDTFSAGLESGAFNLDKVGDAVKEFNIRVKDDSKGTNEAFESLGFNASKMAQTFAHGGPEAQKAFTQVVDAISKVEDPVKKNLLGVQLFGTQFEDLEKDVIAAMGNARTQFDMTKDTMNEVANVKYSTASKAIQGIGRQILTGIVMPIGDLALPALQGVSDWFSDTIPKVTSFFSQVGSAASNGFAFVTDLFTNGFGLGATMKVFNFASMLGFNVADASAIVSGVRNAFNDVIQIKDDLISTWSDITPHIQSAFGSIYKMALNLIPTFQKVGLAFWQVSSTTIKTLIPVVSYIGGKLWPIVSKVFGFLANDVAPAVSSAFSAMLPTIMNVVTKVGSTFSALFNFVKPVIDGIVGAFNFAFPFIKAVVLSAINSVTGIFNGLMTTLGGVLDFITGAFTGDWGLAWTGVKDVFRGVFDGLAALLKAPINAVISLINQAFQSIGAVSIDVPDWVPGMGGKKLNFSFPEIPMLANGAIATGPTLAMIGEGAEDEAVLPLSKLDGLLANSGNAAPAAGGGTSGDIYVTYSPTNVIQGNASPDAIQQLQQAAEMDIRRLEKMLRDLKRDQQRRSLLN
ncbi:phage tail tape measure protein [Brevibacillus nitrificans]|uniref:phage tail tape measure protein n=1 Tax=Brevibacillus nitrificans TaxID=651560 RepID=UPI0028570632|nr:phage tail tape measure protein [Brevibacillus nitrificans]MDR7318918.1 phage-related minor tail protein [Brevibacillus nitrificans]